MSVTFAYNDPNQVTTILEARNPELANSIEAEIKTTTKMAMDGTLYTRRRTVQPAKLVWTFKSLTRTKTVEFMDFIKLSAGRTVRLIDFDGISWLGKITTARPEASTNETGLGAGAERAEYSTLNIEFEGKKIT